MNSTGLIARLTPHQKQILKALEVLDDGISAKDLHIQLCSNYKALGLATVYRGLEVLKLSGLVQSRASIKGEFLYGVVKKHQHYVTCLQCHESITVDTCPICQLEIELEQKLSFKVFFHTLEFFGLCVFCQATDA
ncbi:MAG: transcriptional repressor [Methylacidiphilales bacterium]|nr:transcriptional repressor [Candidatus Methylacidiphilales bacterium]